MVASLRTSDRDDDSGAVLGLRSGSGREQFGSHAAGISWYAAGGFAAMTHGHEARLAVLESRSRAASIAFFLRKDEWDQFALWCSSVSLVIHWCSETTLFRSSSFELFAFGVCSWLSGWRGLDQAPNLTSHVCPLPCFFFPFFRTLSCRDRSRALLHMLRFHFQKMRAWRENTDGPCFCGSVCEGGFHGVSECRWLSGDGVDVRCSLDCQVDLACHRVYTQADWWIRAHEYPGGKVQGGQIQQLPRLWRHHIWRRFLLRLWDPPIRRDSGREDFDVAALPEKGKRLVCFQYGAWQHTLHLRGKDQQTAPKHWGFHGGWRDNLVLRFRSPGTCGDDTWRQPEPELTRIFVA